MENIEIDENLSSSSLKSDKHPDISKDAGTNVSSMSSSIASKMQELKDLEEKQAKELARIAELKKEIEKDGKLLDEYKKKSIKDAKNDAEEETKSKQQDKLFTEEPSLLMLFNSFKEGYKLKNEVIEAGKTAQNNMLEQLNAVDIRNAINKIGGESLDNNKRFIFVANDNGKPYMSIINGNEIESFIKNDANFRNIIEKAANEEELGLHKTVSYSMYLNSNGNELDSNIKNNIGECNFTNVEIDNIAKVLDIIKNHPDTEHLKTIGEAPILNQTQEITVKDEILKQIKEKFDLDEEKIGKDNLLKLINGQPTDVLKLPAFTPEGEKVFYSGRLLLKVDKDKISVGTRPFGTISKETLQNMTQWKGYQFSKEDKENLLKYGTIGKSVEITTNGGQKVKGIIGFDKDTNNLVLCRETTIRKNLENSKLNLEKKDIEKIIQGKPIKKDNLIDNKGVKYSGWIMINPNELTLSVSSRKPALAVSPENLSQVKANNEGARTEALKEDKSSTIKQKQTVSDDIASDVKQKKNKGFKI